MLKEIDVGQIIGGKYALQRLLGSGAMGQVWVARHQGLAQQFAIKLMIASDIQSAEGEHTSLKRFENEAQIAAALSRKTRHIAAVTDYGVDEGLPWLVMELLEGEVLERRLAEGPLPPADAVKIVEQIAKGLAVAHAEGVTHRDLKPANVFLTRTEDGERLVKLLDFGIALMARRIVKAPGHDGNRAPTKLTMKGLVLGSPGYMSPEQAMAERTDLRADVWSLAVIAYETIAGVSPFEAPTQDETILRICNHRPTPLRALVPDASDALANVFQRAFVHNIAKRFQTAPELASALAAALDRPTMSAPTPTAVAVGATTRIAPASKTRFAVSASALLAIVSLGGFGAWFATHRSSEESARPTMSASAWVQPSQPSASASVIQSASATATATASAAVVAPTASHRVAPSLQTTARAPASLTPPPVLPAPSKTVDRSAVF